MWAAPLTISLALGATIAIAGCGARSDLVGEQAPGSGGSAATSTSSHGGGGATTTSSSGSVSSSTVSSSASSGTVSSSSASSSSSSTGGGCDTPGTVSFASGPDWDSFAGRLASDGSVSPALGASLGPAREVCLANGVPASCPPGALHYGGFSDGWHGGDALNALWVWRGDVARNQKADLELAAFEKSFVICPGATGAIALSADDFAEVFMNQTSVGSVGSFADPNNAGHAQNQAKKFDLTPFLFTSGLTITVVGRNGPASFAGCNGGCNYARNPAGVVFTGQISW